MRKQVNEKKLLQNIFYNTTTTKELFKTNVVKI